ncbi:choice-of-anchor tandem repeat NxxGxxAF-containing protein [Haloferula chungangensis]|uniref:Choice-of-anchor tandem repeat NxxGxxAF-containing protein n=1 Tax=Haloferula chungangensis TaxID=1048331 RepID=A0ABW2LEN9_9BACT
MYGLPIQDFRMDLSLAVLRCLGLGLISAAHAQESVVMARSGDIAEGLSGSLFEIDSCYLTDSGDAYIHSTLRENGAYQSNGLFKANGNRDRISALLLSGDPTPDSNGRIGGVTNDAYLANGRGDLAALVPLTETLGGSSDNGALYFISEPDQILHQVSRKGEVIDNGHGGSLTRSPLNFALNHEGQLAYAAAIVDGSAGFFGNAVYLYNNSVEAEVFRSGWRTPEDDGSFQNLSVVNDLQLNQRGEMLLNVGVLPDDPNGSRAGIFLANQAGITTVARENQSVPNGNGTLNALNVVVPSLGNSGHVAFWAQLRNTNAGTSDGAAIFRSEGTGLIEIARRGDLLPDGNGRFLNLSTTVDVNGEGEVAFQSGISGASGGSVDGIFVGDGSSIRVISRVGDPAPGGGSMGGFFENSVGINDVGQICFLAVLKLEDPSAPAGTLGLFLHDPSLGLMEIAREQQSLEGFGKITQLLPNLRFSMPGTLNSKGQVIYRAFVEGDAVVVRWSPPSGAGPLTLPQPEIMKSESEVTLSWPRTDITLNLESTSDPGLRSSWRVRSDVVPALNGDIYQVTVPADKAREFFRLRRSR